MCLQAKLEAELDAAGLLVTPERPKPRALQYADLSKLTFLCACLKEAMRLHPTIPMVSRWGGMESRERKHAPLMHPNRHWSPGQVQPNNRSGPAERQPYRHGPGMYASNLAYPCGLHTAKPDPGCVS